MPERYVSLNFDNADISVVIQTIAELLHLNYIVAPTVRGRITIQTTDKLPVSSLLPVLEQILEVNNFTAVKSGDFYKIVPANQAKQESVETVLPGRGADRRHRAGHEDRAAALHQPGGGRQDPHALQDRGRASTRRTSRRGCSS